MHKPPSKRLDARLKAQPSPRSTPHPARGDKRQSAQTMGESDRSRVIARHKPLNAVVGLLAVGHHTYWPQFPGLLDEMHRKIGVLAGRLEGNGVEVKNFGLVDNAQSAWGALPTVKGADLDLLLIDMVTYATSSTFGVICREVNVPIVLVALQPLKAMDYPKGTTQMQLANDDFCSVPEFTGVAARFGKPVPQVILGHENDDPQAQAELAVWCAIAKVLHSLRKGRIGLMGHVLESMYDMHTDPSAATSAFGCHVPLLEPHDLLRHYRAATNAAIAAKKRVILDYFATPSPKSDPITEKLTEMDLETAARAAVALDGLIAEKDLTGLAYYYEADPGSELRTLMTNLIVGNSLLTGGGFPMCGEYDLKNCIAMLIFERLGIGGSFAEFHPVDFAADTVLVGHDGPHHINIAEGKPALRSLKKYHGKPGSGASVEFQLKEGPITMMSIGQTGHGKFKFIIAEGLSERRPIPPTGNTNTHGRFGRNIRKFLCDWVKQGPTHHFALGIGHHADVLVKVADCLGIESVVVRRHGP
ncbi:MAG: arabinose isomerase [Verrucomicrobiia bacterium]